MSGKKKPIFKKPLSKKERKDLMRFIETNGKVIDALLSVHWDLIYKTIPGLICSGSRFTKKEALGIKEQAEILTTWYDAAETVAMQRLG